MSPSLLLAAAALAADPAEPAPRTLKVTALVYPRYTLDFSDPTVLSNEFDVDRTYLRVEGKATDTIGGRITLDSARGEPVEVELADGSTIEVPLSERFFVFVKHAWVQYATGDLTFRGGIINTPMVGYLEDVRGQRWIQKSFIDLVDIASSADLGVNAAGTHAGGLLSWCAGIYDGETYKSPETGVGKSFQARLTVDPLAPAKKSTNLPISVFVDENLQDGGDPPIFVWVGDAGFRMPYLFVGAQAAGQVQGDVSGLGQSGVLAPGLPRYGYLLLRVDHWDPDTQAADDDQLLVLAGVAHDFAEKTSVGIFYRRSTEAAEPGVVEQSVSVQGQIGF